MDYFYDKHIFFIIKNNSRPTFIQCINRKQILFYGHNLQIILIL